MPSLSNLSQESGLRESVKSLFKDQLLEWPLFAANCSRLEGTLPLSIGSLGEWTISALCLNHRATSLSAKIDSASIAARPCFLCEANRPDVQRAVNWRDYEILVNPYPIAPGHLTIPLRSHSPQLIAGHLADMAALALLLEDKCVFYNGPRCGASAPDHFHFQAFDASAASNLHLPLSVFRPIASMGDSGLFAAEPPDFPFPFFMVQSASAESLAAACESLIASLPAASPEPMLNIAMIPVGNSLRAFIFPRKAHRPDCYGTSPGSLLISPATIEMLGIFVCSRKEDFARLDLPTLLDIYSQVALPPHSFQQILNEL